MFYCEPCGKKSDWPTWDFLPQSRGPCEMCGKSAACFDVPSSSLPVQKAKRTTPKTEKEGE